MAPAAIARAQAASGSATVRIIRTLPLPYRQVLTLALEDLAHDEIADVLGTTANNVTVRLSRARDALRKAMGGA